MKTLEYTPRILTLISAGKKLEAIKMAKDLYGLSLQEAKNMINAYRPGGLNFYTTFELNTKSDYTPEIAKLINEGKISEAVRKAKTTYGISEENAQKMIDNYPQSKTTAKPVESTPARQERQQPSTCASVCPVDGVVDLVKSSSTQHSSEKSSNVHPVTYHDCGGTRMTSTCPCCTSEVEGALDNEKLRKGAKMGAKFATKQGIKLLTGGTVATAAGSVGAAIGSVIPVVGTSIGYFIGYVIGHTAQEIALDETFNAAEKKIAKRRYQFLCPSCGMLWDSNDHDALKVVLRNFKAVYDSNKKPKPTAPRTFEMLRNDVWSKIIMIAVVLSFILFIQPSLIPIYNSIKKDRAQAAYNEYQKDMRESMDKVRSGGIGAVFANPPKEVSDTVKLNKEYTYKEWITMTWPAYIILLIILVAFGIARYQDYLECKRAMKKYLIDLEEVNTYNQNLYNELLNNCNDIIRKRQPNLGDPVNSLEI